MVPLPYKIEVGAVVVMLTFLRSVGRQLHFFRDSHIIQIEVYERRFLIIARVHIQRPASGCLFRHRPFASEIRPLTSLCSPGRHRLIAWVFGRSFRPLHGEAEVLLSRLIRIVFDARLNRIGIARRHFVAEDDGWAVPVLGTFAGFQASVVRPAIPWRHALNLSMAFERDPWA